MEWGPRPIHRIACIACALLAACSSPGSEVDSTIDTVSDSQPDPAEDEITDTYRETVPTDIEQEEIEWEECTPPSDLDTQVLVQHDPETYEVTIESDGLVTGVGEDTSGRMSIEVDFTASDPELGTVVFLLPGWVGETSDVTVGNAVHVVFHWWNWFWSMSCITVIRDGIAIIAGFENDHSCQPFLDTYSWELDDLEFVHGTTTCELMMDDCASWLRLYYDVSCPGLEAPVRILDGAEADVACGPGYHVVVSKFQEYYREIDFCTDMPPSLVHALVVRHPA